MSKLTGKVAVVTGASKGIGTAIKNYGRLDILVNNSGVYEFTPIEAITEDQFHKVFNVNVLGLLLTTQPALKHLSEGASIINLGSVATRVTPPTAFSDSKVLKESREFWKVEEKCYMQITRTSWHGADRTASNYEQREQLGPVGFLPEAVEANEQQLERVLSHLAEKLSELERYVYLIRLCDRNERLFHKLLMSEQIRFLLPSDCRRRLHEIRLILRSFEGGMHFNPSHEPSSAAAA